MPRGNLVSYCSTYRIPACVSPYRTFAPVSQELVQEMPRLPPKYISGPEEDTCAPPPDHSKKQNKSRHEKKKLNSNVLFIKETRAFFRDATSSFEICILYRAWAEDDTC